MEPFISGVAIGLALLIVAWILLIALLIGCFFYGFFRAAFTSGVFRRRRGHEAPPAASQTKNFPA